MLTDKQEKFAQAVALEGMNYSDAYRSAYDTENMTDGCVWTEASLLKDNQKVATRINELRNTLVSHKIMTAQERLEWLTKLVNGEETEKKYFEDTGVVECEAEFKDKLKAIDIMNKMQGEYVQKIEAAVDNNVTINIELSDD